MSIQETVTIYIETYYKGMNMKVTVNANETVKSTREKILNQLGFGGVNKMYLKDGTEMDENKLISSYGKDIYIRHILTGNKGPVKVNN